MRFGVVRILLPPGELAGVEDLKLPTHVLMNFSSVFSAYSVRNVTSGSLDVRDQFYRNLYGHIHYLSVNSLYLGILVPTSAPVPCSVSFLIKTKRYCRFLKICMSGSLIILSHLHVFVCCLLVV